MVQEYITYNGKGLPDLKVKKKEDRQAIEENLSVKNLISEENPINQNLINLLRENLKKTEQIEKTLERYKNRKINSSDYFDTLFPPLYALYKDEEDREIFRTHITKIFNAMGDGTLFDLLKKQDKEIQKILWDIIKENNEKNLQRLTDLSNEVVDSIATYNKDNHKKLDITQKTTVYFCPKCKNFISLNKFEISSCGCGEAIDSIKNVSKLIIDNFDNRFNQFINKNIWLEVGVDLFFKKSFDCSSLCGCYILGDSGVDHEIDNLIEFSKNRIRVLIECKDSPTSVEQIFTLSGKMTDIGCLKGFIITTNKQPEENLQRLARAKNISILYDIFNSPEKKLGEDFSEFTKPLFKTAV